MSGSVERKRVMTLEDGREIWRDANGVVWTTRLRPAQDPRFGLPGHVSTSPRWSHFGRLPGGEAARMWATRCKPGARLHVQHDDPVTLRLMAMRLGLTLLERGGFGRIHWHAASLAPDGWSDTWGVLERPPQTLLLELSVRATGRPGSPRVGQVQRLLQAYEDPSRTLVILGPPIPADYEDLLWVTRSLMCEVVGLSGGH